MMADTTPNVKLDWANGDIPMADDFNRIEWNILSVWQRNLTTATADYSLRCATANYALACAGGGGDAVLGTSNASVNYWHSYQVQIDTRQFELVYDENNNLQTVREKDGTTVLHTIQVVWQDGKPVMLTETSENIQVIWHLQWSGDNLVGITKEVSENA